MIANRRLDVGVKEKMMIQPKQELAPPLRRTKQRRDENQKASVDAKPRTALREV